MGYSIMIPFETEKDKKKMEYFLNENFKSLKELLSHLPLKSLQVNGGHPPSGDLSYQGDTSEPVLGYDYGAGDTDLDRDYFYLICYWMAVHGGKKENGRPVFLYDGYEKWVVYVNEPADKSTDWVEVNEFGYRKLSSLKQIEHFSTFGQIINASYKKKLEMVDTVIHKELKRLSNLWKNKNIL